jgi:splicing factor 3B subunit 3
MGTIAALFPFDTKEDVDFFLHLEMYMRIEALPLCGRDHISFRSFYGPCKVIAFSKYFSLMVKLKT